jgi:hypothetical protein
MTKPDWPWLIHRAAHWVGVPLRLVGLRRLASWLHDRTMPEHRCCIWDLDSVPYDSAWLPADTERIRRRYEPRIDRKGT